MTAACIHPNAKLLDVSTCRALAGVGETTVFDWIDAGRYPWAFNLSCGRGSFRELRVWAGCFRQPEAAQIVTVDAVLVDILGETRAEFGTTELAKRFTVSRELLNRHVRAGNLRATKRGHPLIFPRASLAQFLTARRCGATAA